jgi:GAF domain-containing protein
MATIASAASTETLPVRAAPADLIEDLQRVQKAAQKITSILDLDQLIDSVVNDVAHSFGCLEATVYLHDEERGEMVLAGVRGCSVHGKGHRLKIGVEGMVGYVASTGQMHYAPDVRQDRHYLSCEHETLSEVAIPLRIGERLVGVFTASHPEVDGFPRHQLRILQALCDHVAVAVNNARRIQSERQERYALDREAQEARTIQQALLPKSSPTFRDSWYRAAACRREPWAATGTTLFLSLMGAGGWFWLMSRAKGRQPPCSCRRRAGCFVPWLRPAALRAKS